MSERRQESMNFRDVNPLNNRTNLLSGSMLPMTSNGSQFTIFWRIYAFIILFFEVAYVMALIPGLILVPGEKAIKNGTIAVVAILELLFIKTFLYLHKKLIMQVIRKMNDILCNADETMKDILKSVLKPMKMSFILYSAVTAISIILWIMQPIMLVFKRNVFFYVDYNLPAAFTTEPFSKSVLILSTVVMTIGTLSQFMKKLSLDIYMIHIVLLLTVQYRYTAAKLTMLFRDPQNYEPRSERHAGIDEWAEEELKALCRHKMIIVRISLMIKKLLSVNFSLFYVTNVLRFCFIGIMITTISSSTFIEGISILLFGFSSLAHFFSICFSVQMLLDASTEITDKAFNEGWYQFKPSMQRTFMFLIMANNLECRISAIDKFNLSLPSFITIMQQSYSIAVLFLKMN